ncbi:MAG: phosphatase PAP2-related protein [Puia sp.]|nr:phosphatase PAP2-related protein [Puia sp.]
MNSNLLTLRQEWQSAWQSTRFRIMLLGSLIAITAILLTFPLFFQTIEKREGIVINDWLLLRLPAYDVSVPIFFIIWCTVLFTLFRCLQNPDRLLILSWAYLFLCLTRMVTISLVTLDPPTHLVLLADPLSNFFYGRKFVTRDLFFSGHTSTLFLMSLCLPGRIDKMIAILATIAVGVLLLIQHVHYTLDVLTAPLFAWLVWRLAIKVNQKASPNWK